MYHPHWHVNYPMLFLILGLVLLAWAVTYSIANAPGMDLANLWSGGHRPPWRQPVTWSR